MIKEAIFKVILNTMLEKATLCHLQSENFSFPKLLPMSEPVNSHLRRSADLANDFRSDFTKYFIIKVLKLFLEVSW